MIPLHGLLVDLLVYVNIIFVSKHSGGLLLLGLVMLHSFQPANHVFKHHDFIDWHRFRALYPQAQTAIKIDGALGAPLIRIQVIVCLVNHTMALLSLYLAITILGQQSLFRFSLGKS